jgi:hypothetical protein
LRKRATEADAKLKRLYDAIENGVTDLSDLMLKDRITELKAIRDQARADTEQAEGAIDRRGPTITTQSIKVFARTARKRTRTESRGYRRDYLRALAQHSEVDAEELRIMGSKNKLLRTLVPLQAQKRRVLACPIRTSVVKAEGACARLEKHHDKLADAVQVDRLTSDEVLSVDLRPPSRRARLPTPVAAKAALCQRTSVSDRTIVRICN